MLRDELPGFEECLKYSMLAQRSFLTFVRRDYIADKAQQEQEEAQEGPAPQFVVQREVWRLLRGLRFRCSIVNEVTEASVSATAKAQPWSEADREAAEEGPGRDQGEDVESGKEPRYDIRIIPDLNALTPDQQTVLAKQMMRDYTVAEDSGDASTPTQIFIGIVPWSVESPATLDTSARPHKSVLKSSITVRDWLRHKFWLAGGMPDTPGQQGGRSASNNSSGSSSSSGSSGSDLAETVESIRLKNDFSEVHLEPSVRRYILDIMVHLRMHRLSYHAKGGGVQKAALDSMALLCRLVSYDRGQEYVTPNVVKEVSFLYFPVHLSLIHSATGDTSRLYGSSYRLIQEFLDNVAKVKAHEAAALDNPLFLEYLVVHDVLRKIVPAI